jgi:hypothetical protein
MTPRVCGTRAESTANISSRLSSAAAQNANFFARDEMRLTGGGGVFALR